MNRVRSGPERSLEGAVARAAVAACPGPAWAVDVVAGRIVAVNPQGSARLGLEGEDGAVRAAVPALGRLRALARTATRETVGVEELAFWTGADIEAIACSVRALPASAGRILLIETAEPALTYGPREVDDTRATQTAAPVRSDAEILQEIARRIREGQKELARTEEAKGAAQAGPAEAAADRAPRPSWAATPSLIEPETAARVAHELKTPIGAIAAAAEVMRDEQLGPMGSERYRGYAADIVENARHALEVIDRMMSAAVASPNARVDLVSGQRRQRREINANELCRAVISAAAPLARRAGLALVAELEQGLPQVLADTTDLKQILLNLVTNAIKFTPPGGRVVIATAPRRDRGIAIRVSDTGQGMTRAEIARALDDRGGPALARRPGGGLGLGLPLVLKLAQANEATLDIESTVGRGTTVCVTLRTARQAAH